MLFLSLPSILVLPLFLSVNIILFSSLIAAQKDNGNECDCFKTNGSSADYYAYHRFHDFRNINTSLTSNPEVFTDATNTSNADATSAFFLDKKWTDDWQSQSWNNNDSIIANNASILMINSPNNIFISKSTDSSPSYSTYLTLRTTRTAKFQSAAEFDSIEQNFQFLSARFLARVIGSSGACAGMFSYLASTTVQEADIEILTAGPRNVVQYTNQPSNSASGDILAAATVNSTIPDELEWSSWNAYRLDWTSTKSEWFVNGASVANISFQVPRDPAGLIVNMWSDGGPWTGNMALHDAAYLQIQYIEVVYNTSGPYQGSSGTTTMPRRAEPTGNNLSQRDIELHLDGEVSGWKRQSDDHGATGVLERRGSSTPGCKVVCSVDEGVNTSSIGTPTLLYNNTGAASSLREHGDWSRRVPGLLVGSFMAFGLCL